MLYVTVMRGFKIGYYQGDPLKLTDDCAALKPTWFPSVPRLLNKVYQSVDTTIKDTQGCKGWLANWALKSKLSTVEKSGEFKSCCFDGLVFNKVSQKLGGKVKYILTASAPIEGKVLNFLKVAFCCTVFEAYGLTETSGGASFSQLDDPVIGHVGGPTKAVKWRLKDVEEMNYRSTDKPYPRGELQMKGPSIFSGYYKREDKTKEAFDSEGWFSTGDVVRVYPNGSVRIIDRAKNIFKLSQGEYIAPEKIEQAFALSGWME